MWVHLPLPLCPSVPASEDSNWVSDSFSQDCASLLTWSGTSRQPKFWRNAWMTERLTPLRFGPTLPASTVEDGLERWISSWAEFRVSRSVWPASARGETTSDGFGRTSGAGFVRSDQQLSFSKTFLDSSGTDYPSFSMTLPKRGTMRNGVVSAQPKLAPRISANGCSSWPTATANDAKKANVDQHGSLTRSGLAWPTRTANDAKNDNPPSQSERNTPPLNVAAAMWPPPRAIYGDHPGMTDKSHLTGQAVNWQTPGTDSFRSRGGGRKDEPGLDRQAKQRGTPKAVRRPGDLRPYVSEREYRRLGSDVESFHRDQQTATDGATTSAPVVLNPHLVGALVQVLLKH